MVNAITLYNIYGLVVRNNKFINCHIGNTNAEYTGNMVELYNCNQVAVDGNTVTDNRKVIMHDRAYYLENCSGTFQKGVSHGWRIAEASIVNSKLTNTF